MIQTSLYCVNTSLYCVNTSLYCVNTSLYCVNTSLVPFLSSLQGDAGQGKEASGSQTEKHDLRGGTHLLHTRSR